MKQLQRLHEEFIAMAQRPMSFGALPVEPQQPTAPIFAMERWKEADGALYKTYRFRRMADRGAFVSNLLSYEVQVGHHAELNIDHDEVSLRLQTKDVGKPTELDKEYARFADVLFKDLVHSVGIESWHASEDDQD